MLNQTLDGLNRKLESDFTKPAFNPGGNVFTDCIGCGEEVYSKGLLVLILVVENKGCFERCLLFMST